MEEIQRQAEEVLKSEMTKAGLEINAKENGREGVDFIVKSKTGKQSEVFLQPMDLIAQQRALMVDTGVMYHSLCNVLSINVLKIHL